MCREFIVLINPLTVYWYIVNSKVERMLACMIGPKKIYVGFRFPDPT